MARLAAVTGAGKGIGLEIARQLAALRFTVILTARNEEQGRTAAAGLTGDVHFIPLDVTDEASISRFAARVDAGFGRLDVLINNAGIISTPAGFGSSSSREILNVMETNLSGPVRVTQAVLPLLKKSSDGRVIHLSSGMGSQKDLQTGGYTGYRLSKWSLNGLTQLMAADLKPDRIQVFAMCPGWVKTDMGGSAAPRSVEQGADTAIWLATSTEPVSGGFYRDRKPISW